jgi:hypothetical protein
MEDMSETAMHKEGIRDMRQTRIFPLLGIGILLAGTGSVSLLATQQNANAAKNEGGRWTKSETKAIALYRAEGQAGLDRLMTEKAPVLNRTPLAGGDKEQTRLHEIMDAVAQQKDSVYAGLYWYTDLEAAQKTAAVKNLPILSLRLLGKLTDERSCANSRFFRSGLYSNRQVADFLKTHFIRHWRSERPVPLVTIDYGDGRRIETTLTGNSIHYILNPDGTPIDALPGLYSPASFLKRLTFASELATGIRIHTATDPAKQTQALTGSHQIALRRLDIEWNREASQAEKLMGTPAPAPTEQPDAQKAAPAAVRAERVTETKARGEIRILAKLLPEHIAPEKVAKTDRIWETIAEIRLKSEDPIDTSSTRLMRQKLATLSDAEFQNVLTTFRKQIIIDSARNEYVLHRQLHQWIAANPTVDFATLNTRVYADLFLTPASDPWLGLLMEGQYTGLPNDGVSQPTSARQNVAKR